MHWEPGTDQTTTYNSTGGPVTVNQIAPGEDAVNFSGISSAGGNAQVSTPVTNGSCSVEFVAFGHIGGGPPPVHEYLVQCYDATGVQTEEPFDLLVTRSQHKPKGVLDYDYVSTGANGSLNADPRFKPFQYNSSGKANSVSHTGTGKFVVTMPGSGRAGNNHGTVKVSPYGPGGGNCQIGNWTATRTAQKITVLCFGPTGTPQDRQFLVAYARGNNLMGRNGLTDANASVRSGGANPVYQPAIQFNSAPKAKITVVHINRGQYVVLFAGSIPTGLPGGGNGHIQITPVGTSYHHCGYLILPTHTPELDVTCAGPTGPLADSAFTVQWVVS